MGIDETQIFPQINFCWKLFRVISTEMDNQPATNSSRSPLVRFWPWLVVLVVLLFVGYIRVRLLEMPLERDEGEYAYAGQLILQGIPPYELAYNMKLPGTYFAYALGMKIFGQTPTGIHLTLLAVNSLTIIFVFLLGRKLFGVTAGLVACASYALMSVSPAVYGMAAHATQFVVLFAVPATLLLWNASESNRAGTLFFNGLLYGLAFLMKQQGICFCLFGGFFLVWAQMQNKPVAWLELVKKIFIIGLGIFLPFGLTCIYLEKAGVFPKFWFWTIAYASSYATAKSLWAGLQLFIMYLQATFVVYLGFWVLAVAGLLLALRKEAIQRQIIFIMGFLFFGFLGTATGLYFRGHYFVLLLPAFAIVVGLAVSLLQQAGQSRTWKAVPLIIFAAVLGWNVFVSKDLYFQLTPEQVNRVIYYDNPFVESVAVAKYIREHSSADARIALVGSEPQIYFYAQRHSATGYIYTYALMESQPYAATMQREMIREIESNKPEYLVWVGYKLSWMVNSSSDLQIFGWFQKYAGEFYEKVGIVDTRATGETIYLWDDDARNYHGSVEQYLVVYKRKPGVETVPAKPD